MGPMSPMSPIRSTQPPCLAAPQRQQPPVEHFACRRQQLHGAAVVDEVGGPGDRGQGQEGVRRQGLAAGQDALPMGGERRGDVAAGQGAPQPLPFGLVLPVGLAAAVDVDDQALEAVPVGDEGVRIGAFSILRRNPAPEPAGVGVGRLGRRQAGGRWPWRYGRSMGIALSRAATASPGGRCPSACGHGAWPLPVDPGLATGYASIRCLGVGHRSASVTTTSPKEATPP